MSLKPQRQRSFEPTSLDIFICSLIDRGLRTGYELHRQGGLSLGSTNPALGRLETQGLVRKQILESGDRPRHSYRLSPAGRKLARTGWHRLLIDETPRDLEHLLRVTDVADHYGAPANQIREFLERAADQRITCAAIGKSNIETVDGFAYVAAKNSFELARLRAEAKFLRSCSAQFASRLEP
jgi:DNA-binding PadR family transcriptional regulator